MVLETQLLCPYNGMLNVSAEKPYHVLVRACEVTGKRVLALSSPWMLSRVRSLNVGDFSTDSIHGRLAIVTPMNRANPWTGSNFDSGHQGHGPTR